jgi:hypothetical protein
VEELKGRLAYEFVFDIVSYEDLVEHKWLSPDIRDDGHTRRLVNVCRMIQRQRLKIASWICIERAIFNSK